MSKKIMSKTEILSNLCYYDKRNPEGYYSLEWNKDDDPIKKIECCCDNCFYGRSVLAEELLAYMDDL